MRYFAGIYNSQNGLLALLYTTRGTAAFEFVPVYTPVSPNQITKGMKVYNYEKKRVFSLTFDEVIAVLNLIKNPPQSKTTIGSIQYDVTQDGGKIITISHFPGSKEEKMQQKSQAVSRMTIFMSSKGSITFIYEYKDPTEQVKITIPIRPLDFAIVVKFLENMPVFIATLNALEAHHQSRRQRTQRQENGDYFQPVETGQQEISGEESQVSAENYLL